MADKEFPPPDGYHYKWRVDPHWKRDPGTRKCRSPHCTNDAVAALNRGIRTRNGRRDSWWYYCDGHLFGRRIMHGKVKVRYLASNASC